MVVMVPVAVEMLISHRVMHLFKVHMLVPQSLLFVLFVVISIVTVAQEWRPLLVVLVDMRQMWSSCMLIHVILVPAEHWLVSVHLVLRIGGAS